MLWSKYEIPRVAKAQKSKAGTPTSPLQAACQKNRALTSRQRLGDIFCCRTLWMVTCMDMPQEAPHAPSSDPLSMDLCINSLI